MEVQLSNDRAANGSGVAAVAAAPIQAGVDRLAERRSVAVRPGAIGLVATLFKLRIGASITLSALAGALLAAGAWPAPTGLIWLALAVWLASSGAAGCNHYFERDIDALMRRTRSRPFVVGHCVAGTGWLLGFMAMIAVGSALAAWRFNPVSGLWVLAGALTYAVVYTLWLKRRTHWNIVIGGAAGSFAVLAGAAAFGDWTAPAVLWLALVLFLWTPSHFWSLAIAMAEDYRRAGVPMLPVSHGLERAARWTLVNTVLLVASSVALAWLVAEPVLWFGTTIGGGLLLLTGSRLLSDPVPAVAMRAFRASLIQLVLLLATLFIALGAA